MIRTLALVALLTSYPGLLEAQQQTGSLSGTVFDPDGRPLPGVSVTVDGTFIPPTTVASRANGTWRFPALPPDEAYVVTFRLDGFASLRREALTVELNRDTRIATEMALAVVSETVEVTAASPAVDVTQSGLSTNLTAEFMQSVPSVRDPWALLRLAPGIQLSGENVGGEASGSQRAFSINGSRAEDNIWAYDGAEVTTLRTPGATSFYFDFDAFEEVSIDRAGNDPSVATAGVRLSVVTRRGGNRWRGSGRFYLSDKSLHTYTVANPETGEYVGNYGPDDLVFGYLGRSIDSIRDWGLELGGPLVGDRLFGWVAYGTQDIQTRVGTQPDNSQLYNWNGKLNWHASNDLVASFAFLSSRKTKQGRGAGAGRPDPTTQDQDGTTTSYTAKAQYTLGGDHFLEATLNHLPSSWELVPRGGLDVQPTFDWATFEWGRSYLWLQRDEPSTSARLDGSSYLAGDRIDHELRFGYSFRNGGINSASGAAGDAVAATIGGTAAEAWLIQGENLRSAKTWHGAYVGDTITAGRWVVNVGLRYDYRTAKAHASASPAHPIAPDVFPAVNFPGYDPGFAWTSLSPRLGLTYDLGTAGRSIVRLNAGRYYSQGAPPVETAATTNFHEIDFEWFDRNGNLSVDPGETGDIIWVSPGFDIDNPDAPVPNVVTDTDSPITDELLLGIEHEIARDFAISATAIFRRNHREVWTIREGEDDPDFWVPTVQNVAGWGELELYVPAYRLPNNTIHKQRPGYEERYAGLEIALNKRLSARWMANASFTWGNNRRYFDGPGSYTDPTNIPLQDGQPVGSHDLALLGGWAGSSWNLKASGLYQLPAGFALSGFLQVREGLITPQYVVSDRRPFGYGRALVLVEPFGASRLSPYWNLDLRAEKAFEIGSRGRLHLIVDAFNLTNNDIVLGRVSAVNGAQYGRATEVMSGRTLRFGVRFVLP